MPKSNKYQEAIDKMKEDNEVSARATAEAEAGRRSAERLREQLIEQRLRDDEQRKSRDTVIKKS